MLCSTAALTTAAMAAQCSGYLSPDSYGQHLRQPTEERRKNVSCAVWPPRERRRAAIAPGLEDDRAEDDRTPQGTGVFADSKAVGEPGSLTVDATHRHQRP